MSNYLAVATVTATLGTLLTAATSVVQGAEVSFERPDKLQGQSAPAEAGINVYLYRVEMDPTFRNVDLPTRRPDGSLEQLPTVALDLSYLITCYGDDSRFEPQLLLGAAESVLHTQPILTPPLIDRATLAYDLILGGSNLEEQSPRVRLTPFTLSLDDMSKIWSVYYQTPYLLSVTYQASVVLISPEIPPPAPALPVRHQRVHVFPFDRPVITEVSPRETVGGGELTILGRHFSSDPVDVIFATESVQVPPAGSTRLTCPVPRSLRAGVNSVVVAVEADLGTGSDPDIQPIYRSNVAAFVVRPDIQIVSYQGPEGYQQVSPPQITVTAVPAMYTEQRLTLWLDEAPPPSPGVGAREPRRVYGLQPLAFTSPSTVVPFNASTVAPGTYTVRLMVDDAESVPSPGDWVTVP